MKNLFLLFSLSFAFVAQSQVIRPMDDLLSRVSRDNQGKTAAMITRESIMNYDKFVAADVNDPRNTPYSLLDERKPTSLPTEKAVTALKAAMNNEVVSLDHYEKYDKLNKGIGFCFGRAMFVNLYLVMGGFNRANIKKAFVVGPMSKGAWGWHVTTIVQSKNKSGQETWLAIDPIHYRVMEVKDWYKAQLGMSDDGKLRLYIAEAGKFGAGSSRYDERGISDPFYNNYFTDMMSWFNRNDVVL